MESKSRNSDLKRRPETARFFSVARGDGPQPAARAANSGLGITIQIRLRRPVSNDPKLLTRENTEFWLSASD